MLTQTFLQGRWALRRKSYDYTNQNVVVSEGSATFSPVGDKQLIYKELGFLKLNHYQGDFYQSYLYDFTTPGCLHILYSNGDLFYKIDSTTQDIEVVCAADIYRGSIFEVSEDKWLQTWRVHGPKKKYHMVTQYVRAQ